MSISKHFTLATNLENSWLAVFHQEFEADYMRQLSDFLTAEKKLGKTIYPSQDNIFRAFNSTPLLDVRVVIVGQDPYHAPEQAHGLSFSVPRGVCLPPSLRNIYKELVDDCKINPPQYGNLQAWADQGVLLLNSVLTVEQGKPTSHKSRGWERFTDAVIDLLNRERESLVFMLWGSYAQQKGDVIDRQRHLVLHAPHPSPLSAYRGFFGCRHFSQANDYLIACAKSPINWQI